MGAIGEAARARAQPPFVNAAAGANGVGYTNYPDNSVRFFLRRAALGGIDLFRIFDCLNWVENMRIAIDTVCEEGKIAEGAICYPGDILDPARSKYDLKYYVRLAKELENAGCHVLAIKDMAGLLKRGREELSDAATLPTRNYFQILLSVTTNTQFVMAQSMNGLRSDMASVG